MKKDFMRVLQLMILGTAAFAGTMTVKAPDANAVVYCAVGVVRAGCVARPVVGPTVRGVARRTTRRVVRRSDVALKHDIFLLGRLQNGIAFYRFSYNGSDKAYVGVMAQEVRAILPAAVVRGSDGYLSVAYDEVGVHFQSYRQWIKAGARVPTGAPVEH